MFATSCWKEFMLLSNRTSDRVMAALGRATMKSCASETVGIPLPFTQLKHFSNLMLGGIDATIEPNSRPRRLFVAAIKKSIYLI